MHTITVYKYSMSERAIFTYQTRLNLGPEAEASLRAYAGLYGQVERSLLADMARGETPGKLKSTYLRRFGITARQFNAVALLLKGKIASIKERRGGLINEARARISKAEKVIARFERRAPGSNTLHQKKRRLVTQQARLARMEADHQTGIVRLCFGSRRMFRAQFDLSANGYADHADWLDDWRQSRASEFFVIGSKDETAGCQGCVASVQPDGSLTLRLRLPDALGKYIVIEGVRFAYGQAAILDSLAAGRAISYRFKRDAKGWRVFVSSEASARERVSDRRLGAIGIDLNADHLAVAELDRHGNLLGARRIACGTYGKTQAQARAVIGDAVKAVVAMAVDSGKPVVAEKLDFSRKKAELETARPGRARMLSGFAYAQVGQVLRAACFRAGVEVLEVNPAYTSTIGAVNHAQQRGISVHQGAATVIARRGLGFSERPSVRVGIAPACNGGHVTFDLPVRNRSKPVWSFWSNVRKKLTAAHAAHARSGGLNLPPSPLITATRSVCSHRALSVKLRHANRSQHCSESVMADVPQ